MNSHYLILLNHFLPSLRSFHHTALKSTACATLLSTILTCSFSPAQADDLMGSLNGSSVTEQSQTGVSESTILQRELELRNIEEQLLQKMKSPSEVTAPKQLSADKTDPRIEQSAPSGAPSVRTATYTDKADLSREDSADLAVEMKKQPRTSHSIAIRHSASGTSSDQNLAIAESQVTILSRELETTRRGLRSAERRIEELSELVKGQGGKAQPRPSTDFSFGNEREQKAVARPAHVVPLEQEEEEMYAPTIRSRSSASATVIASKAAIRTGPSKNESMLFLLPKHEQVTIDRRTGEWYRVVTVSGARGWIYGQSLLFDSGVPASSAVQVRAIRTKYEPTSIRY